MKGDSQETDWYICAKCGERGYAQKNNFMSIVIARDKMCSPCIDKKNLAKASATRKATREKNKIKNAKRICEVCNETFTASIISKARACSPKCRGKLQEKSHFYKGLQKATREADMTKVHLFGQGKYAVSVHDKKKEPK